MTAKQEPVPHSSNFDEFAGATCADEQSALALAASVAAQSVISRLQDTSRQHCVNLNLPHSQSARARWYARAQQGLQDWISHGGFSLPVDAHDAAALAGTGATRPTLYRLPSNNLKIRRSCVE
ncbi:MAG TPA: hypothetical protein VGD30_12375 [Telluria sp.]